MMKGYVSLAVLVAAAAAQPELSSSGNDVIARRQVTETANFQDLNTAIVNLSRTVSTINGHMTEGTVNPFLADLQANNLAAAGTIAQENALLAQVIAAAEAEADANRDNLAIQLSQQTAAMDAALMSQTIAMQSMAAVINSELSEVQTAISTAVVADASTTAATLSTLTRASTSQMAALTAQTSTAVSSINSSMTGALLLKKPHKSHYWKGGCSNSRNGGWNYVCHNRVLVNTAAPYFRSNTDYKFIALVNGIFRVNSFTINSSCSWAYFELQVQGSTKWRTHGHPTYSWWQDEYINAEVKANTNQWWAVRGYAACGHTFWNGSRQHGVLETHYEGTH